MKKITWIRICSTRRYGGGTIYGEKAREVLGQDYDVEVKNIIGGLGWKYLKRLEWFFGLIKLKEQKDLWIREDPFSVVFQFLRRTRGKNLAVVHHIDFSLRPFWLRPFFYLPEKMFYLNLKKSDAILTVSNYWQNHLLKLGYKNVYRISNSFNLSEFNISSREIEEFKKRFNLEGKPIIYLGNCQEAKGVVEAYRALKDLNVYLVTSGDREVRIPARNFGVEYRDYLKLLKASSIIITMSKLKEGWCRTAHEAMLLKRPVIGSGKGGMRELLEGGKQIICEDFNSLKEKVEYLLSYPEVREKIGKDGYNFAKNFTLEKFKKDWLELINKLL